MQKKIISGICNVGDVDNQNNAERRHSKQYCMIPSYNISKQAALNCGVASGLHHDARF